MASFAPQALLLPANASASPASPASCTHVTHHSDCHSFFILELMQHFLAHTATACAYGAAPTTDLSLLPGVSMHCSLLFIIPPLPASLPHRIASLPHLRAPLYGRTAALWLFTVRAVRAARLPAPCLSYLPSFLPPWEGTTCPIQHAVTHKLSLSSDILCALNAPEGGTNLLPHLPAAKETFSPLYLLFKPSL